MCEVKIQITKGKISTIKVQPENDMHISNRRLLKHLIYYLQCNVLGKPHLAELITNLSLVNFRIIIDYVQLQFHFGVDLTFLCLGLFMFSKMLQIISKHIFHQRKMCDTTHYLVVAKLYVK